MNSDTDDGSDEAVFGSSDSTLHSDSEDSLKRPEPSTTSRELTNRPNTGTSNSSKEPSTSQRKSTADLASTSGHGTKCQVQDMVASISSSGALTTLHQDETTSSTQQPSCSSLVTVRSGPSPPRPVGGSVSTCTEHVTCQASGDEILKLLGAIVKEGEKSDFGLTLERRKERHSEEVHVHLTKTDIYQPQAVAVGEVICVGPPQQKRRTRTPGHPSHLKRLRNKTEKTFNEWTEGMVMTQAARTIINKISKGKAWVTVTGCPGEGKTTAGYLVLKHLHNRGREVFDAKTPEDYFTAKAVGQSVILLNDIFGALTFDSDSFKKWQSVLSDALALSEHKKEVRINKSQNQYRPEVTVILISRLSILREASSKMGKLKHLVLKVDNIVDLTEMIELGVNDRMKIWKCHAEQHEINIDSRIVREVCSMKLTYGFPHCCRLFAEMYKKNNLLNMKHFFLKPLEYLNQSVESLIADPLTGPLLRQMLKNDGSLNLEEVGDEEKRFQYRSEANTMKGSYFVLNGKKIEFHHPSIYDSAAFLICKIDPQFVISFCSLSFLNERVRLKDLTQTSVIQSHQIISIDNTFEKNLLERFWKEFQAHNIAGVLSHSSFYDEGFVSKFMQNLLPLNCQPSPFKNIKDLFNVHDKHSNKSFLFLMTKSGSDKLLRYIHQFVVLTEEEQSEALFGVCEHSSVSALQYLLLEYKDINFEVTDGDNQTPLLVITKQCSKDMIRICLTKNINVNPMDNQGITPLLNVCIHGVDGDGSVVRMLLEKGANFTSHLPLSLACEAGHANVVKALLHKNVSINKPDWSDWTPFDRACWNGHVDVVRVLLEKGADINKIDDPSGLTPLHGACLNGNVDCVTLLLDKGADVNKKDRNFMTPFHMACLCRHVDVVAALLDKGADINKTDWAGQTPLHRACFFGHLDIVTFLLDKGADVNKTDAADETPLNRACLSINVDIVTALLDKGADINKTDRYEQTPLQRACVSVHADVVAALLDKGAHINITDRYEQTPLHLASSHGHVDNVRVLIDKGADINKTDSSGHTPLHGACWNGYFNCVTALLEKGPEINKTDEYGKTPLHIACGAGRILFMTALLDKGADINKTDRDGQTPLHEACSNIQIHVVRALVDKGADVNKRNAAGMTPLLMAFWYGIDDVVTALLDKGADIDNTDNVGWTLLQRACWYGRVHAVTRLLEKGADINKTHCDGQTPLYIACCGGHVDVVTLLLDKGADVHKTDNVGFTPLHITYWNGHGDVERVLLSKGATTTDKIPVDKVLQLAKTMFKLEFTIHYKN